jgi:GNAT superfamily N-acetyltransferase
MNLTCFGCDTEISADTVAALVDAFETHADNDHDWTYDKQSIRNYAQNVGEAAIRLTGPTKRFENIGPIDVQPVTSDRIDDWLQLFDHDGFADNPEWASCYCLEPHGGAELDEPLWTDSRSIMADRLKHKTTEGYLAYVDGTTAGWVNASKRSDTSKYAGVDPDGPHGDVVVSVSCFVIAPPYRRHGVAESLLDTVIEDAANRGAQWVEAYPKADIADGDAENFKGTMSMYTSRGFETIESHDRYVVVRKRL